MILKKNMRVSAPKTVSTFGGEHYFSSRFMKYYQVMLEGKDFLIDVDGKEELQGYFTTRWVKASAPEDAELKAVDLIKNDDHLISITKNMDGSKPAPMVYLSEMSKVNWFQYYRRKPGRGYSFFPMANNES